MDRNDRQWLLWPFVRSLAREATLKRGVPAEVADVATRVALSRFGELSNAQLDIATRRRVAAYFWGVVRRRAIRSAPGYAARVVRAALAADLAEAGWDAAAIYAELERAGLVA